MLSRGKAVWGARPRAEVILAGHGPSTPDPLPPCQHLPSQDFPLHLTSFLVQNISRVTKSDYPYISRVNINQTILTSPE